MNDWPLVKRERLALCDFLDGLPPDAWLVPSLCPAWTVKGVVAHLTSTLEAGPLDFARAAVKARGSFNGAPVALAARWEDRSPAQLIAGLRGQADNHFRPPGLGYRPPLTDILVHGQDIAAPLGLSLDRPLEAWRPVLDYLTSRGRLLGFQRGGRPAVTARATDLDWQHGTGPEIAGSAVAIGVTLAGRSAYLDRLEGPGVNALRGWLDP